MRARFSSLYEQEQQQHGIEVQPLSKEVQRALLVRESRLSSEPSQKPLEEAEVSRDVVLGSIDKPSEQRRWWQQWFGA